MHNTGNDLWEPPDDWITGPGAQIRSPAKSMAAGGQSASVSASSPVETLDFIEKTQSSAKYNPFARLGALLSIEHAFGHGFLFVPVLLGAGAAAWFSASSEPSVIVLSTVAMSSGLIALASRYRHALLFVFAMAAMLLSIGGLLAAGETTRKSTRILDSTVTTSITGIVERREMDAMQHWRYIVRLTATAEPVIKRPPTRISLLARSAHSDIRPGQMITGRARLSPPSGPALPRLNDFAFSSYFDRIGAVGFFYAAPRSFEADQQSSEYISFRDTVEAWLYGLRSTIATRIRNVIGGDAGAFAASIVTDERRAISTDTMDALRVSGLAHIVAISGLNMALAAGIFFVGARMALSAFGGFAQGWPVKKLAASAALIMATAYYLISGFAVSAERAYLMMAIILMAVFFDRQSISLRNVALSAIVILCLSPSEVMGPSFQMSFAATAALVSGYAFWTDRNKNRDRLNIQKSATTKAFLTAGQFFTGIAVTSFIGGISTVIYAVEHFHRVSAYGLAANLAAMPVISFLVMPFGLVGMLLMPFGLDGPFLQVMGFGLSIVIDIANEVASWGGNADIGRQHPWFLVIASTGFLILTLLRTRLRLAGIALVAVAVSLSIGEAAKPLPDLLVSETGEIVALLGEDRLAVINRSKAPDFIFSQWQRALVLNGYRKSDILPSPKTSIATSSPPSEQLPAQMQMPARGQRLTDAELATARERMENAIQKLSSLTYPTFVCDKKSWCVARPVNGPIIITVEKAEFAGMACDLAGIVVFPGRLNFKSCRSGALLLTSETLRRTGALEIRFPSETENRSPTAMAISATFDARSRPWTRHRHYDWRTDSYNAALPDDIAKLLNDSGE